MMMRALVDTVRIDATPHGTQVIMTSRPVSTSPG
jgi:hypothetical protein